MLSTAFDLALDPGAPTTVLGDQVGVRIILALLTPGLLTLRTSSGHRAASVPPVEL
jgi:hypothetical protein